MKTVTSLKIVKNKVRKLVDAALEDTGGLLRLAPCWVPRSFLQPGLRLKLHPDDTYAYGLHRGGMGLAREWRLESDWGTLSGSFERFRYPPYGLNGGEPGSKGRFLLVRDDQQTDLPSKISGLALQKGDRVRLETSGGGGWGPPEPGSDF